MYKYIYTHIIEREREKYIHIYIYIQVCNTTNNVSNVGWGFRDVYLHRPEASKTTRRGGKSLRHGQQSQWKAAGLRKGSNM